GKPRHGRRNPSGCGGPGVLATALPAAQRVDFRARSATVDAAMVTPRHIGIVACSAEGAALCYRTIVHEGAALLGEHRHPEVTLSSLPLSEYMARIERGDWPAVAD